MAGSFSSTYHSGPVTALKFLGTDVLIAGIGSSLHFYSLQNGYHLRLGCEALPCRTIHGIQNQPVTEGGENLSCCFGEKCLRVWKYDLKENKLIFLSPLWEGEDWIWDVCWLTNQLGSTLALALGHNVVTHLDWKTSTVLHKVHCEESCIIYSAHFIGHTWSDLVLAAGTVFNQVVLWSVNLTESDHGKAPVLHRLKGHKGVIFGIDYHPGLRRLCSVSDDRSIWVWQVSAPGNTVGTVDWAHAEFTKLNVLYGHSARVWSACLLSTGLVSVGEDSSCCVWDYDGNVVHKYKGHMGKSIWSLAVDPNDETVVTGGGDHSIRLWKLHQKGQPKKSTNTEILLPPEMEKGDFPRTVTMRGFDHVVVMTNEGFLFEFSMDDGEWTSLLEDSDFRSYTVVSVSPGDRFIAIGSITGKLGVVVRSESEIECVFQYPYEGRIFSVVWLNEEYLLTTGPEGSLDLLHIDPIPCAANDCEISSLEYVNMFELPVSKQRWVTAACFTPSMRQMVCGDRGGSVYVYQLENSKTDHPDQPILTLRCFHGKAGVTYVGCHGDQVYTCGRDGRYVRHDFDEYNLSSRKCFKVAKGFDWIEKLIFTDDDILVLGFHAANVVIWSTERNQHLLKIECGGGHRTWGLEISPRSEVRVVFLKAGEVLLSQTQINPEQNIIKGSLHGRELTDIKHVASAPYRDGRIDVLLTCSEDTNIVMSSVTSSCESQVSVLQQLKGHISSVRTMTLSDTGSCDTSPDRSVLMFSAGGRAQLKVWKLSVSVGPQKTDSTCNCDTSSSSNSAAGRCETSVDNREVEQKFSKMDTANLKEKKCTCESAGTGVSSSADVPVYANYEALASHMLRDPRKKKHKPWKQSSDNSSPETRYMDLTAFHGQLVDPSLRDIYHFIGAACSDAAVRLFMFEGLFKTITLLGQSSFHDHCVLKIGHFVYHDPASQLNHMLLYSGGTEGRVAFWDITDIIKLHISTLQPHGSADRSSDVTNLDPVFVLALHQSGINSISVRKYEETDEWLMVTGGDDNAVIFSTFSVTMDTDGRVHFTALLRCDLLSAHAAQVTGNRILDDHHVLTISIDQRLCLWGVKKTIGKLKAEMQACKFVNVSDVSNMDVWKRSEGFGYDMAISGEGIQILHLDFM